MGRAATFGQFSGFSQGQVRIGERQAGDRLFDTSDQSIALILQRHVDVGGPQEFQIAIEAANIQAKPAGKGDARLRPGAKEFEQAIHPRRSFRRHRFEGAGRTSLGGSTRSWLPGHAFLGLESCPGYKLCMILNGAGAEFKTGPCS